ncbi:MFS transporter [Streptomyces halstedii]
MQVVGWLIRSEVYPLRIRPAATGPHAAALWGSNLLVTSTALTLVGTLTLGGAMLVYATLHGIAWIVVFFRVPETKGRSLEAIEQSRGARHLPARARGQEVMRTTDRTHRGGGRRRGCTAGGHHRPARCTRHLLPPSDRGAPERRRIVRGGERGPKGCPAMTGWCVGPQGRGARAA